MNDRSPTNPELDKMAVREMNWWDRFVLGMFRGTVIRYVARFVYRLTENGQLRRDDVESVLAVQGRMLSGDNKGAGFRLRMLLVTPLWWVVKLVGLMKNDHPFAKDSRESFTNKVTPEAVFLGFLIWLCMLLAVGSVTLHKASFAP